MKKNIKDSKTEINGSKICTRVSLKEFDCEFIYKRYKFNYNEISRLLIMLKMFVIFTKKIIIIMGFEKNVLKFFLIFERQRKTKLKNGLI